MISPAELDQIAEWSRDYPAWHPHIARLAAEIRRLRQLFFDYADHDTGCLASYNDAIDGSGGTGTYPCKCGYQDELERLSGEK